jgi:hypothetical protein
MTADELRALFLSVPESAATRAVAVAFCGALLVLVLWLVRTRRLREEFTPIWVAGAICTAVIALNFDLLRWLTALIGAWTVSATIFLLALSFLGAVSLFYAVRLSKLVLDVKNLSQEVALLRAQRQPPDASSDPASRTTGDDPLSPPSP